jgi:hypothetical protein
VLFSSVLKQCFFESYCPSSKFSSAADNFSGPLSDWVSLIAPEVSSRVFNLVERLHRKFVNARIFVLTYPILLGAPLALPVVKLPPICKTLTTGNAPFFSAVEIQKLVDWTRLLNTQIFTGAHTGGAEVVKVEGFFRGHGACSPKPYINFIVPKSGNSVAVADATFHPNRSGQSAFAQSLECWLSLFPTEPDGISSFARFRANPPGQFGSRKSTDCLGNDVESVKRFATVSELANFLAVN